MVPLGDGLPIYPELSAKQVKHIILNSGLKVYIDMVVPKSKDATTFPLSEFSKSGRILNAFNAIKMADAKLNH